jgi:hypothetical protein
LDLAELVAFVRRHGRAVLATRGPAGDAQATDLSVAITDDAEFILEMSIHSQRYANILAFAQVALVIGEAESVTVQAEGVADVLTGAERDRCLRVYFQQFPAGRERALQSDLAHVRVRPSWVRLRDARPGSPITQEINLGV